METIFTDQTADVAAKLGVLFVVLASSGILQAWVCTWLGDDTPRKAGQTGPNPLKHIDAFGSVLIPALLLIASQGRLVLGSSKPIQRDPTRLGDGRNLLIALTDPVAKGLLAGAALGALLLLAPIIPFASVPHLVLEATIFLAVLLGIFALLPIPGLPGAEALRFLLPEKLKRAWDTLTRYGLGLALMILLLVALWQQWLDVTPLQNLLFDLKDRIRGAFLEARARAV